MTPLLAGIGLYVLLQLAIGVVASRRIKTEDDYLVAGRSLGPVLATFTVFATWFGAETCIAAAGAVYTDGLAGGSADPFGYGLCIVLAGAILAVPLWRLRLTTLADLFRLRFDASVERLAVVLMVPTSLFWAAAQVRAFGQVLSAASGFEVELALGLAATIVAARSERIARNATLVAGGSYLLIGLLPVTLGVLGSVLVPGLTESEQVLPVLAERYLPTFLAVVFSGALVSAILSTVDSALLVAAGLVSHNVVVQMRPGLTERQKVRIARVLVVGFGVLAWLMAARAERVYELIEQASAFGSSGIVVVVLFGLFTRIGGTPSAVASLLAGVVSWCVGAYVWDLPYPYLTSLAVAAAAYLVTAVLSSAEVRVLEPA